MSIHPDAINALLYGYHGAPFDLLGPHPTADGSSLVRAFRPWNDSLYVVDHRSGDRLAMNRLGDTGLYELILSGTPGRADYHYETDDGEFFLDPYAFPPLLTDYDRYLFSEGNHHDSYEKMGAHLREVDGVKGVNFAVWAPNARRVSIVGDFNRWDARLHPMQRYGENGIWELFIPGLSEGAAYKYSLRSQNGDFHTEKSDPYAFFAERRPRTASIVADLGNYVWEDDAWIEARTNAKPLDAPVSIYELHPGSWRRSEDGSWLNYRDLAAALVAYVKDMGYTHIELMPVAEHPFDGSWGYQVTGYFAATSRYGSPEDFMYFVDTCHQNGIGVIVDWVPAHFPKDGHGLGYFDGTHLFEHADFRQGEHPDWGTYIFNYGRTEVRSFLISNALFWLKKYHVDGLRVDAVSSMIYLDFSRKAGQWIPNQYGGRENLEAITFLREMNTAVHSECPGAITIAEESTAWPMVSRPTYLGGLGFTFKWNMGWMHDTLDYISTDPVYRRWNHNRLTFSMMYAFTENFVLSLSHDEVVHGKGALVNKIPGDWWQKLATLRLLFGYQYAHPGKKLNFMGQEIGQWREWSEARELDWGLLKWPTHQTAQAWVRDLNHLYQRQPALYERDFDPAGFRWIEPNDAEQSVFSWLRFAADPTDFLVVVCNFTPVPRHNYRVGVPEAGYYAELLNSDAAAYGGGGMGNMGGASAEAVPRHGQPHSLNLTLPPLGILILKRQANTTTGTKPARGAESSYRFGSG